jgi:hypothetical protein
VIFPSVSLGNAVVGPCVLLERGINRRPSATVVGVRDCSHVPSATGSWARYCKHVGVVVTLAGDQVGAAAW